MEQPPRWPAPGGYRRLPVADLLPCTVVTTIPQKELRNSVSDVLRRAEAGERFTITVAGRPVAELGPAARRSWVGGSALKAVFGTPVPRTLNEDLERFPGSLVDPFA
jgi:prevent-host-death family protein